MKGRALAAVVLAGAILAGCGGSSSLALLPNLASSPGPMGPHAAYLVPNGPESTEESQLTACDNLWGYLQGHPTAVVPHVSAASVRRFLDSGHHLRAVTFGGHPQDWGRAFDAYWASCHSMFAH